jgi:hypothetical protein
VTDTTTIRVSRRTHEAVTAHARESGRSADEVISAALRALEWEERRRQAEEDAWRLAQDPEDRAEVAAAIREALGE